jgi:hypothetical protein
MNIMSVLDDQVYLYDSVTSLVWVCPLADFEQSEEMALPVEVSQMVATVLPEQGLEQLI